MEYTANVEKERCYSCEYYVANRTFKDGFLGASINYDTNGFCKKNGTKNMKATKGNDYCFGYCRCQQVALYLDNKNREEERRNNQNKYNNSSNSSYSGETSSISYDSSDNESTSSYTYQTKSYSIGSSNKTDEKLAINIIILLISFILSSLCWSECVSILDYDYEWGIEGIVMNIISYILFIIGAFCVTKCFILKNSLKKLDK